MTTKQFRKLRIRICNKRIRIALAWMEHAWLYGETDWAVHAELNYWSDKLQEYETN